MPIQFEKMKENILLQIENACIVYDREPVVAHCSLQLNEREMVCVTGTSGCGKTSLLKGVMGLVPLSAGSITVCGKRLSEGTIDSIRRKIAWIPQELALPCEWVSEMVELPFTLRANRNHPFNKAKMLDCFTQLGLEHELFDKRVVEVSGGQRQRMMIAVAVLLEKPLMVVDEPTSALDSESVDRVIAFLRSYVDSGHAVLAVSHDERFVTGCDRQIPL